MKTYSVISFATHGLIAGEIGSHDADLVLTPPAQSGDEDDGLLSTGEIAELSLDADLVILSACNTAAGDSENEEGHSGLADAFFYAGARSLLVSHWPVYSDAATDLTTHAIDQVTASDDMTIAHGLRLAMLAALDAAGDDPRQQHPAYWAPFTLVGDGAVRF